jgi:hypothetical protein
MLHRIEETNMMTDDWKPSHRETFQHKTKPNQQQQQQQEPVELTTDVEDLRRHDALIAATLAAGLFPRTPNLDAQKAVQIYFEVLDALQKERPKA